VPVSLGVVAAIIATAIILSLRKDARDRSAAAAAHTTSN
jgi:hypothetical protein